MATLKPQMHVPASYKLKQPWTANATVAYHCIALRRFEDIEAEGRDVFEEIYQPKQLNLDDYNRDAEAGIVIATLRSDSEADIIVPISYIESWEMLATVKYSSIILAVDLGALPDTDDLEHLKEVIEDSIEASQGQRPTVEVFIAPHTGIVTESQHDAFVMARNAARANRTSDYQQLMAYKAENEILRDKLRALEQMVQQYARP